MSNLFDAWNQVYFWSATNIQDSRGSFSKVLPKETLTSIGDFHLKDMFITDSQEGVIRGMHLQTGASSGTRLVHVLEGTIIDVLLDLRPESKNYGGVQARELTAGGIDTLVIPGGVAHGFETLSRARLLYAADKSHDPENDTGFNPLSINHVWLSKNPIISKRDLGLPKLVV